MKLGNSVKANEYAHKSVKVGKQEESYGLLMKILISEKDFRSAVAVANAAIEYLFVKFYLVFFSKKLSVLDHALIV